MESNFIFCSVNDKNRYEPGTLNYVTSKKNTCKSFSHDCDLVFSAFFR